MRDDPVALWWRLAEKTPPCSTDACQTQTGLIFLVATAAQIKDDLNATVADERDFHRRERPTPDGVTFARAALTSWPRGTTPSVDLVHWPVH